MCVLYVRAHMNLATKKIKISADISLEHLDKSFESVTHAHSL